MSTNTDASHPARPAWVDEGLFPFESHYIEIDGNLVHYIDEGSGPTMLFLHGVPTWSFLYRHIVAGLRDDYRCIALDYPGCGLSKAAEGYGYWPREHSRVVEGVVQALDLTDITLMVHDWGGPIGLGVAGRNPDRFKAFVIGNTMAFPIDEYKVMVRLGKIAGGPIGKFIFHTFNAFVFVATRFLMNGPLSAEEIAAYRGQFPTRASRRPTYIFPKALLADRPFLEQVEAGLARLKDKPVLFIWGEKDLGPGAPPIRERFKTHFPNERTVLLPDANHFIQEDAPDEIIAAIKEWWPQVVG